MATKSKRKSDPAASSTARLSSTPVRLLLAAAAAVGLSSLACGPLTPVSPTWKDDVRPLLVSRCIRCHDTTTHVDKKTSAFIQSRPAPNFNFATIEDVMAAANAASFLYLKQSAVYTRTPGPDFMPPAPAEALDDWQIDILESWAADPR
jgi:hypothetical protein